MSSAAVLPLFFVTALAEIGGCYLIYLWAWGMLPAWALVAAAALLAAFAALLSLHPNAARAYAGYGGVYVASAVMWGWLVEKQAPDRWDLLGSVVCLVGTAIIAFGPHR